MTIELGRNEPCHCGSKKKYKKCHLEKDMAKDSKVREKENEKKAKDLAAEVEKAEKMAKEGKAPDAPKKSSGREKQGWAQKIIGKASFFKSKQAPQRKAPPANKGG